MTVSRLINSTINNISIKLRSHQIGKAKDYHIMVGKIKSGNVLTSKPATGSRVWSLGLFTLFLALTLSISTPNHRNDLIGLYRYDDHVSEPTTSRINRSPFLLASAHIVMSKDDRGQNLVLSGEDGAKGKKGQHKLIIAGSNLNENHDSNLVVQEDMGDGDVVISGNSMVIPSEDGHIVLADGRSNSHGHNGPRMQQPPNMLPFWLPYMSNRMGYSFGHQIMPFFGGQFG